MVRRVEIAMNDHVGGLPKEPVAACRGQQDVLVHNHGGTAGFLRISKGWILDRQREFNEGSGIVGIMLLTLRKIAIIENSDGPKRHDRRDDAGQRELHC